MKHKTAVVLFNLGGPDRQSAVRPFLFNMFSDKAIIPLPSALRYFIAQFISRIREKKSQKIYAQIGGKSPILEETKIQSAALETILNNPRDQINDKERIKAKKQKMQNEFRTFIAMRYWHPFTTETCIEVSKYKPDSIILLPLYPQFSTTTTESSFAEWDKQWQKINDHNLNNPAVYKITSYYDDELFIASHANLLVQAYNGMVAKLNDSKIFKTQDSKSVQEKIIVLFSAHGLPQSVIDGGDPYQSQTEASMEAIMRKFKQLMLEKSKTEEKNSSKQNPTQTAFEKFQYRLCYQSKVGPMKWLEPSSENEIIAAAQNKMGIIVLPISFVSEHSETLVELDIDYRWLAETNGAAAYIRVPALRDQSLYIECLAKLCHQKLDS